METTTLTMAGHLAHAGAARPVADLGTHLVATTAPAYGTHQASAWTKGAIAMPSTGLPVFGRKNRSTRPSSELSP